MNTVTKTLIATDFFVLSGLGFITPIFAIFIERSIAGGSIAVVGIAQAIFMVVKSVIQLLVGRFNDRDEGYRHEFWFAVVGYALIACVPFLYIAAHTITMLYIAQATLGLGSAFAYPGWIVLFSKFLDTRQEGREWSMYSTIVVLAMAAAAVVGGWMVERYGFASTFYVVAAFVAVGGLVFLSLLRNGSVLEHDHRAPMPGHLGKEGIIVK